MENKIELKVGDVFRLNKARKKSIVVSLFDYNGSKMYVHHHLEDHIKNIGNFKISNENYLCGVTLYYGNVWSGIVEVNDKIVRGTGGKQLIKPKDVKPKKETPKKETKPLTDFQKYVQLQNSGRINMTDTTSVAAITGLPIEKVEDIMWHYNEYKSGKRS